MMFAIEIAWLVYFSYVQFFVNLIVHRPIILDWDPPTAQNIDRWTLYELLSKSSAGRAKDRTHVCKEEVVAPDTGGSAFFDLIPRFAVTASLLRSAA